MAISIGENITEQFIEVLGLPKTVDEFTIELIPFDKINIKGSFINRSYELKNITTPFLKVLGLDSIKNITKVKITFVLEDVVRIDIGYLPEEELDNLIPIFKGYELKKCTVKN